VSPIQFAKEGDAHTDGDRLRKETDAYTHRERERVRKSYMEQSSTFTPEEARSEK
jgi:hypothetical protein